MPTTQSFTVGNHHGLEELQIKREELLRFVQSTGHEPIYIDLPDPREMEE